MNNQIETVYKIVAQGKNGLFTSININAFERDDVENGVLPDDGGSILQYKLRHQTLPTDKTRNALFVCKTLSEAKELILKDYTDWIDMVIFQGYGCNVTPYDIRDKRFTHGVNVTSYIAQRAYFSDWFIPMRKMFFFARNK